MNPIIASLLLRSRKFHSEAAANIGGNNFRLISEISYLDKTIIINSIYTHAEYDKEMWKK
ncbi:MAG: type II toxin-antitoxin system HigB family toxin [Crocosphaera sp.]